MSDKNSLSDIEKAWLQLEDVQDFGERNEIEILEEKEIIASRIQLAMELLHPYVRDDMSPYDADSDASGC